MPDTIAFHDIAGLVAGAHKGEGLGNQFLANIRETDAIVHVVRAHTDAGVVHPEGRVDPLADIETIETELIYADLEQAERRLERSAKQAKCGDREVDRRGGVAAPADRGAAGRQAGADRAAARRRARRAARPAPLTAKPVLFVANVDEGSTRCPPRSPSTPRAWAPARRRLGAARGRAGELSDEDAAAMREDLGLAESGLQTVVRGAFALLDLVAFFTAGEDKPAQSWHLRRGLSVWHAAGLIHSDIQRGFVRAEVIGWDALRRRRRLRGRARPGHAAARGARLRGRRR